MEHSKIDTITIEGLAVECIIGLYDWERTTLQKVVVDFEFSCDARRASQSDRVEDTVDYKDISKSVASFVASSQYYLVETLAENVARFCILKLNLSNVFVRISKPGALRGAENVSVSVSRHHSDFSSNSLSTVYLSIGSNIQPDQNMDRALRALGDLVKVVKISQVYETVPQGLDNAAHQRPFWNVASEIQTEWPAEELKQKLLSLEADLGRVRTKDKFAPRVIDIDVLIYDHHWNLRNAVEQAFIMIPLTEIGPHLVEPKSGRKLIEILASQAYADHPMKCLGKWMELKTECEPAKT